MRIVTTAAVVVLLGATGFAHAESNDRYNGKYLVSGTKHMAPARKGNSNDSANSQWFIMFGDAPSLNGQYTVIGEVLSGMDVVDKIKKGEPVQNPDKMVKVQVAADAK